MRKLNVTRTALPLIFLFFVGFATLSIAGEQKLTFEGELITVDTNAQAITVKNAEGKAMEFSYDQQTQVTGAGLGAQGLSTMAGNQVKVHYEKKESANWATKIEVLAQR